MSHFSGQHGRLFLNSYGNANYTQNDAWGNQIAKVRDWNVNMQHQPLDTTTLGDIDRTKTHGLRSYSASGTLLFYHEKSSNFKTIIKDTFFRTNWGENGEDPKDKFYGRTATDSPEMVKMSFILTQSNESFGDKDPDEIVMFGYITSFNITVATGEVVQGTFTFEGHGAPRFIGFP